MPIFPRVGIVIETASLEERTSIEQRATECDQCIAHILDAKEFFMLPTKSASEVEKQYSLS